MRQRLAAIRDEDARENYRIMLNFRDQLLAAPSLEAFYAGLFLRDVAVPPLFIDQTVQAILRGILDGEDDGLKARAAELFFRRQRVNVENGAIRLADDEIGRPARNRRRTGQPGQAGSRGANPAAHDRARRARCENARRILETRRALRHGAAA
jgi:hypothetical protein